MSPEELELLQSTVAINQYLSAEKTREILADLEHKKPFDCREQSLYTAFADPRLKNQATDIFASLSVIRDSIRKKKNSGSYMDGMIKIWNWRLPVKMHGPLNLMQ